MPQLSIYMNDELATKSRERAKRRNTTLSHYVADLVQNDKRDEWPEGFFELFGSLKDMDIERPPDSYDWSDEERGFKWSDFDTIGQVSL